MVSSLSLLHTFVLVGRVGRMRDVSTAMSVTPGAISQRIRQLEDRLGYRLFTRSKAGVMLNPAGQALFTSLDEAFRKIETVDQRLDRRLGKRVTVTTMGSFASSWLVPRLKDFARRYPETDVIVEAESRVVDLANEPVDLAIRHGLGDYPGLLSTWLMAPELMVVASPSLPKVDTVLSPADCLRFPLLHDADRSDWRLWFEAHGIATERDLKGPSFNDDYLLVRAAMSNQGLALIRDVYVDEELRSGQLVNVLNIRWPSKFAYYAVTTAKVLQRPAVRNFVDWLSEQADLARRDDWRQKHEER
ncbi:Gcv operon activator [Agrobacterium sp. DSM 25558]|uniref:LysR substrate-binding domain-containing protein n=1 Tax=Agrobacterium sp. DSM 25558 TaxID=1907665 RepID=UPI0009724651|nr:LysR substrate-binding domain-containing protein [Agrobacterium sp. DSM 25558]SCX22938.1 Gcv operon activator [Agrobacterium sp. DSM 25558]